MNELNYTEPKTGSNIITLSIADVNVNRSSEQKLSHAVSHTAGPGATALSIPLLCFASGHL